MDIIEKVSQEQFNIPYLFPFQRLVISNILRRSGYFSIEESQESPAYQLVLLPTGAGKSLCFMLPAALLEGLTIVVFPLLGLMADQQRRTEEAGIPTAILKGGMSRSEIKDLWKRLSLNQVKMLITNPEMLALPQILDQLKQIKISHFVIDEAHTIPEWGESFRPSCLGLGEIVKALNIPQMTAFTATASPLILNKITKYLFVEKSFQIVRANPDRINIYYQVIPTLCRLFTIEKELKKEKGAIIIFCNSRHGCEQICSFLNYRLPSRDIRFYHAGLDKSLRTKREQWFFNSENGVLLATCAYGMGMDKSNVRLVIHYALPSSIEAYLQESGRAGRDRQMAKAILLYHPEDKKKLQKIENNETKIRYEKLLCFAENNQRCRRETLLSLLEAKPDDCQACDVCLNKVVLHPDLEKEIIQFIYTFNKRLTLNQSLDCLKGRYTPEVLKRNLHHSLFFAIFKKVNSDDLQEAIEALQSLGKIRIKKRGINRGKVYLGNIA